jgi:hypothetical protein
VARIRVLAVASCAATVFAVMLVAVPDLVRSQPAAAGAPTTPPAEICGNSGVLRGPATAPIGAVTVPAGNNSGLTLNKPATTYWFAPGTHTLGFGQFSQIIPADKDSYIGAPGAIISGQGMNDFAFTQDATDVMIEYLTIKDFGRPGGNNNQGVVNHDSGSNWTIEHNTIEDDAGAGVMLGSNDILKNNCITENGQYGFSSYTPSGPKNITITHNEISYNDTYNWEEKDPGCGCSGGGKLWDTDGVTFTDNYLHNNENVGIWADTDNSGIDISDNFISDNYSEGVIYEISYNGLISDNTFIHNGVGSGPKIGNFPTGAIYISESGSDSRVPGPYGNVFSITGNTFTDNWSGVVLWENSNRFCGPDSPDNAGSLCTLVDPSVASTKTCRMPQIAGNPLFTDCRWRTLNVSITDNEFTFTRTGVGNGCSVLNGCGFNAIFSIYGSTAPYRGWIVPRNISDNQNNHFAYNSYTGPWLFMAVNQGIIVSPAQWTKGFVDTGDGSDIVFHPQDAGSTFAR